MPLGNYGGMGNIMQRFQQNPAAGRRAFASSFPQRPQAGPQRSQGFGGFGGFANRFQGMPRPGFGGGAPGGGGFSRPGFGGFGGGAPGGGGFSPPKMNMQDLMARIAQLRQGGGQPQGPAPVPPAGMPQRPPQIGPPGGNTPMIQPPMPQIGPGQAQAQVMPQPIPNPNFRPALPVQPAPQPMRPALPVQQPPAPFTTQPVPPQAGPTPTQAQIAEALRRKQAAAGDGMMRIQPVPNPVFRAAI